jgi:manganese transport protein
MHGTAPTRRDARVRWRAARVLERRTHDGTAGFAGRDPLRPGDGGSAADDVVPGDGGPVSGAAPADRPGVRGAGPGRPRQRRLGDLRLWPFLGPAFVACIAYIDPGNFATNIQGGSAYGYRLVWVVLTANLVGMLVQVLSAKLGVVSGRNLPEVMRERFPRALVWPLWVAAEVVAMATDLAELLGAAIGFQLLFGLPLVVGALLAAASTLVILHLHGRGFRLVEAIITVLLAVIAACYVVETVLGRPSLSAAAGSLLPPRLGGSEATLLATGILGATVMPHVIYLHSALTQERIPTQSATEKRRLLRFQVADVVFAMTLAGLVNLAMLMMAAVTFNGRGATGVASIEEAHRTLQPLLGTTAATTFALSLLVSGIASSAVGTMAGQVIMAGFIGRRVPVWVRRVVTMAPPLAVIALGFDPTRSLVISQVVLSFGIPLALVPLALLTSKASVMGDLRNRAVTTLAASVVAAGVTALNVLLLVQVFAGAD